MTRHRIPIRTLLCSSVCALLVAPSIAFSEIEVFSLSKGSLYRLPQAEFSPEEVGPTGHHPTALDFSPAGVLYAIDPSDDVLLTIDDSNGVATVVGSLGIDVDEEHSDITFGPGGRLWMSSGFILYLVDLQSGLASYQVDSNPGFPDGGWFGITFVGDVLYTDYSLLHTIDPATGLSQPIAPNWPYWGMDALGDGVIWGIEQYNTFQNDWWALVTIDPATNTELSIWRVSVNTPFSGIAVRSVAAAAAAVPALGGVGILLFSCAIFLAAMAIIRKP